MAALGCSDAEPMSAGPRAEEGVASLPTGSAPTEVVRTTAPGAVRLLFVGDLMVGRRVGELAAMDPESVFEDVKVVVRDADLAMANLESPLTERTHVAENPFLLEADPALAALIAAAGFDILGIANNHAGDAGAASVIDTMEAVAAAGMDSIGGGADLASAWEPRYVDVAGLRVALLAIDVSGQGLAAGAGPGIAAWDTTHARAAVTEARSRSDVVVVGIHGGVEEWGKIDPFLDPVGRELAAWGADVVWGHGPHVRQPVVVVPRFDGAPSLLATSLGNFLFDQQFEPNCTGLVLETLVDGGGLIAWRLGLTEGDDLRVHFDRWLQPEGDAALIDGEWWSLERTLEPALQTAEVTDFEHGDVIAASEGNLSGEGAAQLLVSYRHEPREVEWDSRPRTVDRQGRTAHLGVFELDGTPIWMSHRPPGAAAQLAACDGAAVFAYSEIDGVEVVAVGAGVWNGFGFTLAPELPGVGTIGCVDVDGDGSFEPVVVGRP
jgi:poly-gamma-glutamate capsule biosynthesis protein CapA/YwtB (metallophosphatase superfamily)